MAKNRGRHCLKPSQIVAKSLPSWDSQGATNILQNYQTRRAILLNQILCAVKGYAQRITFHVWWHRLLRALLE